MKFGVNKEFGRNHLKGFTFVEKISGMDIHVSNLPFKLKEEELTALFETYGKVESTSIVIDHKTRQNKGFGFVKMANEEDAKKAITDLNGHEIQERKLKVTVSLKKEVEKDDPRSLPYWKRKPKKQASIVSFDGQHKKPKSGTHKKRRGHGRGTTY